MKFQLNITGGAYFPVQRPDMVIVYTLGRKFHIDDTGLIVTEEGYWLFYPFNPWRITPPDAPFDINEQGQISVFRSGAWQVLGNILVYIYTYPEQLDDLGNGYFANTPAAQPMSSGHAGESGMFANVKIFYLPETVKKRRPVAALDKPGAIGDFIIKARKIVEELSENTGGYFTNPSPPLSVVIADTNALETAEDKAKSRLRGSVAQRNVKYKKVLKDLRALQRYVQTKADNAIEMLTATTIITASGFELKTHGTHTKDELKAVQGKVSGTVKLAAKAVNSAGAYEWQIFTDTETGWINLPATLKASTKVTALNPGTIAYFRCRAVKKTGVTSWTQEVSVIVT